MQISCIEKLKQSSGIYGEAKIFVTITEDLSKRILQRRKSKMAQMKRLQEEEKKTTLSIRTGFSSSIEVTILSCGILAVTEC